MTPTIAALASTAPEPVLGRISSWLEDVWVLTRRNLIHVRREPQQLGDATIQPVLFTLLFVYVFGSALAAKAGGDAKAFLIPGLLVMNLTTSTVGTAIGLSTDLSTGVINRLRTLPMAQTSILAGRSISDLLAAMLCATFVAVTGLVIGWRPDASGWSVLAGMGLALLFSYALSWLNACIGLSVKSPEAAQGMVFVLMFPLAFVSNIFTPTQGMPGWIAAIANWNPVSAVASSCRALFGAPNPSATVNAWPMHHPVLAALLWSGLILAVCVPLAGRLYRKKAR
jgi:ABC transporter DrrB family efflux protein